MTEVQKLYYIAGNAFVPEGKVTSTARRGSKWFDQIKVGEMVNLSMTETDESFGLAIVVHKELIPYITVLDEADHNHVADNPKWSGTPNKKALAAELRSAYGDDITPGDLFTVLHILRVTGAKVMSRSTFGDAYKAIESENRYQIAEHGEQGQDRSIDEWCLYIRDYAEEASHQATRGQEWDALNTIRKVTTMGVVALQTYGSPHRQGF